VIFVLPGEVFVFYKMQHFSPSDFLARRFYQEGAAASRADQGIDFLQQVFGKKNVGAFSVHVHSQCALSMCFCQPHTQHTHFENYLGRASLCPSETLLGTNFKWVPHGR
jgi:hypothetical protein